MKFYKLGLLTLLISLFILSSCKRQEGIGLDVDPGNQINGTLTVDTSIVAITVPEDSVVTSGFSSRSSLAYFKDPEFGTTEAGFAAILSLPGKVAYTVPTGTITIDSAILSLPYADADAFYGDSLLSTFKVDVHQLAENIQTSKTYYNTKKFKIEDQVLGSKTFQARSHDTLKIYSIVKGAPDTIIKVKPQVRIPISSAFINQNFFTATASALKSTAAYENFVKGLYVTIDKNQTTGIGGNMFFNVDSANITVYYKLQSGSTVDTSIVALPLGSGLSSIKHTYSAKVQAALDQPSNNALVYLQGLAGLRAKLSFPNVKNILSAVGNNAVINRAELVVKVAPGTTTPFAPSPQLTLYKYDLAHQRVTLQDASSTDPRASGVFGGAYVASAGEYHFLVTAYLQDLIKGKTVDYGTFLAPVTPATSETVNITPTATYAQRSVIVGKNSPYRIKLNIIYTKLN